MVPLFSLIGSIHRSIAVETVGHFDRPVEERIAGDLTDLV
jgi:hypothetical protein